MNPQEQEDRDFEIGASHDDAAERFAGEFGKCPLCGARTVDPMGHCEPANDEPEPDDKLMPYPPEPVPVSATPPLRDDEVPF